MKDKPTVFLSWAIFSLNGVAPAREPPRPALRDWLWRLPCTRRSVVQGAIYPSAAARLTLYPNEVSGTGEMHRQTDGFTQKGYCFLTNIK